MSREREIEIVKEWYAAPGYGKKGEVLDHECDALLGSLEIARRAEKRRQR